MNHYTTLGVSQTATLDEIKRAYKRLATKHHPDKGGNPEEFKKIVSAYETLSDQAKRSDYDFSLDTEAQLRRPFEYRFRYEMQRNRDVTLAAQISLESVITGTVIDTIINEKVVSLKIPPGINHQGKISFPGLGENQHANVPPGDLIVRVLYMPHKDFEWIGADLHTTVNVSVWDAMLGCKVSVNTITNTKLEVKIKPGVQSGTIYSCKGEGLPISPNSTDRGNLLIKVVVAIPAITATDHVDLVTHLKKSVDTK